MLILFTILHCLYNYIRKILNSIPVNPNKIFPNLLQLLLTASVFFFFNKSFSQSDCYKSFKYALSTAGYHSNAFDVVDAGNNEFFVVGTTGDSTGGRNVLVTKMTTTGAILWSKVYGGLGNEYVRKASPSSNGGLLITGSTTTQGNSKTDILCMEINPAGFMRWVRRFSLNSPNGDMGMDIIETNGGYAVVGIGNFSGFNSNAIVIRLNSSADIVWNKSFDFGVKENGVGVVENGNNLVITADVQQPGNETEGIVMEITKSTASVVRAVKLHPLVGGLSSPYIFKDPLNNGYWINGHLTNKDQANKMQQVAIRLDNEFNIAGSYRMIIPEDVNSAYSGFQPLPGGGFITCSGMEANSNGFIFSVKNDGGVNFAKKLVGGNDRKLTRLKLIGDKIVSVGSDKRGGLDAMFVISFDSSGKLDAPCQTDTAALTVENLPISNTAFTWKDISETNVKEIKTDFAQKTKDVILNVLCTIKCDVPSIKADFDITDTVCANTPVNIVNKTVGGTTFFWNFGIMGGSGSTNIYTSADSIPLLFSYKIPGIYNVTLTVDKGLVTETTLTKVVNIVAPPAGKLLSDTSFCAGDSLVLQTSYFSSNFSWSTGDVDSFIIIKKPGKYWIASNYYGCAVSDSINVIEHAIPIVNLGSDTVICVPALLLNAFNENASYLWQDGSTSQTFNVTTSGMYKVLVTDKNRCYAKDSIKVTMYENLLWQLSGSAVICAGGKTELLANGTNIKSYSWFPIVSLSDPLSSKPTASPLDTTVYICTVTGNNGCKASDSVRIDVKPTPYIIAPENMVVCAGTKVALPTTSTPGVTYTWSPNEYLTSTTAGGTFSTPDKSITYLVNVVSPNGCSGSDSVSIQVNPSPTLMAATLDTLICAGSSANLAATTGAGNIIYSWSPAATLSNTSIANPVATPTATTKYYVEAANEYGCVAKDSVTVAVRSKGAFSVEPAIASTCPGKPVTFTAKGADQYQWYAAPTLNISGANATATAYTNTTYKVVVTDTTCKIADTLFATVNISSSIDTKASKTNDVDCILPTTTLKAEGGVSYQWFPAETLSNSNIASPVATPSQTTKYYVKVTNAGGCYSYDSVTVNVFKSVENGYQLPNAFTPNNDGNNDCFGVRKWGTLTALDFSIFNRQGKLIFHTNNPSVCWDGTLNGSPQLTGSYIYVIKAQVPCGSISRSGSVVLIR